MKTQTHWPLLVVLLYSLAGVPLASRGQAAAPAWSVAYLNTVLDAARPGQRTARVGDMEILLSNLRAWRDQLAGQPSPQSAFAGATPTWTAGNVYYTFSTNQSDGVPPAEQRVFRDCAQEWASFANVHFIPRTTQANYVLVSQQAGQEGGLSTVGMIGGQQTLSIGPTAWNHATVCHELGHTLGLVHEHQRSDRDSYVTVFSNNVESGEIGNFVLLPNSRNQTAYDFLSVMHYNRNSFSIDPTADDTIEPLPPYIQYLNIMGQQNDPVLSASDRAGMAAIYGVAPPIDGVVTNTLDSGPGSLRIALYYAFDHPGTTITFNLPTNDPGFGNAVFTIRPTDRLPSLVHATTLDGGTEPVKSNPNGPSIVLNGALAQPPEIYASGLRLGGTNCTVKSLVLNGFSEYGIVIDSTNATGNVVSGCYLGVGASGFLAFTNTISPIAIDNGASSNTVGGTTPAARNVISGSHYQGLVLRDPGTRYNQVIGNYVGLTADGSGALSNTWSGVAIFNGAQSNLIGGFAPAMRNIISGNGDQGVTVSDPGSSGNVILGNYIGLNPGGTAPISNRWAGVNFFNGASGNIVGVPGAPNVISGNGDQGVLIQDTNSDDNVVQGNYIGLDPSGARAISNRWAGVQIYNGPRANLIGGIAPGAGNVISGNGNQGVFIGWGSDDNVVEGNVIGLDATGLQSVPNGYAGVELYENANGNWIGGGPGARNFISGNANAGIAIDNGASANIVQGNSIGVNAAGNAIPNAYQGVVLFSGAISNQIGGTTLGAANLIAGNTADGVDIFDTASLDNSVRGNSIVGNGYGGLNLYSGGNFSAPPPSLSAAVVSTNLSVSGSLSGSPGATLHLDFYANPLSSPQAAVCLGARDVTIPGGGSVNFTVALGATQPEGQVITAAATDANGNTSSLSSGVAATATDSVGDGIPDAWRSLYFGGNGAATNAASCASCDPGDDGMSNYQKFLAGLNPTNAASVLRIESVSVNNNVPAISFLSAPGPVYRLEFRDDLDPGPWNILADQIDGSGGLIQVSDPGAAGWPNRFYRLAVLP